MKKTKLAILVAFFFVYNLSGQDLDHKKLGLNEFDKEHYQEAIDQMQQALAQNPNDPEVYYYLSWFNHYLAYDSRPLQGYDFSHSEKIFKYLSKAIELKPDYGDAKYFYGAECSGNAFLAMQNYDLEKLKFFFNQANDIGAYPDWLKELGRNLLNSCSEDAILFAGGNADFDICSYLQLHENLRTDVTVIPIGNIDRPWYVQFLKDGLAKGVRPVNIGLNNRQINDIHPFKWDTTDVIIPVSPDIRTAYSLDEDYEMTWTVEPDFVSGRQHAKRVGEATKNRTYLSVQRAILLHLVEENFIERPIYFSNFCNPFFYGGLDQFFSNKGLVSELTPIKTDGDPRAQDFEAMERLLVVKNLSDYREVTEENIPRISGITFTYHRTLVLLAQHYVETGQKEKFINIESIYDQYLTTGLNPDSEKYFKDFLDGLKESFNAS
jgi:tetratricopeptide (TPR) repeat protein